MPRFSVILFTAAPPGQGDESGGAFIKIDGREALLRSVELFLNRDPIQQIQLVFSPEMLEEGKRKYGGHLSFSGVKVLGAGPRLADQLAAAGEKVSPESTHVLVHDAARPAVPYSDIDALLEGAEKHAIVALAAPLRAALMEVDEGGGAVARHLPSRYQQLLSPICYTREKFQEIARTKIEPHPSQMTLLRGSGLNMRLGSAADASLLKAMLNLMPKPKVRSPLTPFDEAQW